MEEVKQIIVKIRAINEALGELKRIKRFTDEVLEIAFFRQDHKKGGELLCIAEIDTNPPKEEGNADYFVDELQPIIRNLERKRKILVKLLREIQRETNEVVDNFLNTYPN